MTRQVVLLLASLAALAGSASATLVTMGERERMLRGHEDATIALSLPPAMPRLGVNAELSRYSADELADHLSLMESAGVAWLRQFFPWDEIEPSPGQFDWEPWDSIVQSLAAFPQIGPMAVLMNSPAHASGSDSATAPPRDVTAFAAFCAEFAARYGAVIDHYQIWDEPNLEAAWGGLDPEPVHYLALLKAAWQAIHDVDPNAEVIAAALAPTVETGPRNISDIDYLNSLYALGAADWMDAVAAKPYGFDSSPQDRVVSTGTLNFSRIIALREVMQQHGDADKPLHAGAWGWNSLPADWAGAPSIWGSVTLEEQVSWTLAALERARREWPWLGSMMLQHWQPYAAPDDPLQGFALLDVDNRPKALLTALAGRPLDTLAGHGLHAADSPRARYSGNWSFGPNGADFGWLNDSQVQFDFAGEEIALRVREGDYVAWFYATVDGRPANALPRDADGNAYLTLTSATRQPREALVTLARDLDPGSHRLVLSGVDLVMEARQPRWALAGFAVGHGDPALPWGRQILAGSIATGVAAVALLMTLGGFRLPRPVRLTPLTGRLTPGASAIAGMLASLVLMLGMLLTWGDAVPAIFRRETLHPLPALLTAGLLMLQPGLLITLLALLILFLLFFHRPAHGLLLTILWAPLYLFPIQLYHFAFPMAELMILLTGLAWALRQALQWARRQRDTGRAGPFNVNLQGLNALDLLLLAWLALGVLACIRSPERAPAVTELRVLFVEPALFYLIFRREARDLATRVLLTDALIATGTLVALIGLWLFLSGEGVITAEGGVRRLVSVYGSPNNAALFLERCLPFALAWALPGSQGLRRVLALLAGVIILLALLLTQSAGALLLGLPLSLAALLLLRRRRQALAPLLGLAAAGLAALALLTASSPRFARLLDFTSGTLRIRLQLWQSTLAMLRDDPVAGLGLDQFLYAYRDIWILPDAWREPNLSHPHNILFDFWIRLGIAGPLLLIALMAAFWRKALRAYRSARRHAERVLLLGAMASMVSLVAHGLVDNSVYVNDLVYVFVLLCGLASCAGDERLAST